MNGKQLLILLVLVAAIGGAGLVVYKNQSASRQEGNATIGKKLLDDFPVNDVAHLTIQRGASAVNLVREGDQWRVRERNDYPASFPQISEFLIKARDLKIVQSDKIGPSQLPRLELAPGQGTNAAIVVEFKDANDKPIRTLLLGKKHLKTPGRPSAMGAGDEGWPDGRYVKTGAESDSVAVISDALENIEPKPDEWLSKDFFKVEKPKAIAVTFADATNSWKVARDTEAGDWRLVDAKAGEQLDSTKTGSLAGTFGSPSFTDVFPGAKIEAVGTNRPVDVGIETFDHFNYAIRIGAKTNEDYLVTVSVTASLPNERVAGKDEKPEDKAKLDKEFQDQQQKLADKLKQEQSYAKWTYLVPSWVVEPVLKDRTQLLQGKEEPKAPADTGKADAPAPAN